MCVILVSYDKRPSVAMIEAAWDQNSHGGGLAWREDDVVKWSKGLSLMDMKALIAELPLPFVAHFRIASCGGLDKGLTHPFPLVEGVPLDLDGDADSVLFHNGHWGPWKVNLIDSALRAGMKLEPGEKWSDTRAMAMITTWLGEGFLDLIEEKVVTLGVEDLHIFGNGWKDVDGIYCSNDLFEHRLRRGAGYHVTAPASLPGGQVKALPLVQGEVMSSPMSKKAQKRLRRKQEREAMKRREEERRFFLQLEKDSLTVN